MNSTLLEALANDKDSIASQMIKRGEQLHVRDSAGMTPLHYAVIYGKKEFVLELLNQKSTDVNVRDVNGNTPLWFAVFHRHHDLVEALLNAGADALTPNKAGRSPTDFAQQVEDSALLELLLRKRVNSS